MTNTYTPILKYRLQAVLPGTKRKACSQPFYTQSSHSELALPCEVTLFNCWTHLKIINNTYSGKRWSRRHIVGILDVSDHAQSINHHYAERDLIITAYIEDGMDSERHAEWHRRFCEPRLEAICNKLHDRVLTAVRLYESGQLQTAGQERFITNA